MPARFCIGLTFYDLCIYETLQNRTAAACGPMHNPGVCRAAAAAESGFFVRDFRPGVELDLRNLRRGEEGGYRRHRDQRVETVLGQGDDRRSADRGALPSVEARPQTRRNRSLVGAHALRPGDRSFADGRGRAAEKRRTEPAGAAFLQDTFAPDRAVPSELVSRARGARRADRPTGALGRRTASRCEEDRRPGGDREHAGP